MIQHVLGKIARDWYLIGMNKTPSYQLDPLSILDVDGQDAGQILHNLTTNDVKALSLTSVGTDMYGATGCETFITDVRGKTLGHLHAYRTATGFRLVGASGQSQAVADHADKYTIREDVAVTIRDSQLSGFVLSHSAMTDLKIDFAADTFTTDAKATEAGATNTVATEAGMLQSQVDSPSNVFLYQVNWLGADSVLMLVPNDQAEHWKKRLQETPGGLVQQDGFHLARTLSGFPWYGVDLNDKNLPQEADRDAAAISFTKGCYLGQETVARLDALGQVQKKTFNGNCPSIMLNLAPSCLPTKNW